MGKIIVNKKDIPEEILEYFEEIDINRGSIWTLSIGQTGEKHYAVFNKKLVDTPIKATCPEFVCSKCRTPKELKCECNAGFIKGVVYDTFGGTATTARSAKDLNRDYISSDISEEYDKISKKLLQKENNNGI
jgi:hypothetical protein